MGNWIVGREEEDPCETRRQHGVEQERVQVVPGLEEDPDRRYRGDGAVEKEDPDPRFGRKKDRSADHERDGHEHDEQGNAGGHGKGNPGAVVDPTEGEGKHDEQGRGGRNPRVGDKGLCDHLCEHGHHQDEGGPGEEQEEDLSGPSDLVFDDPADRLSPMAQRGDQSREVVNCTDEDASQQDPQEGGKPSEDGAEYGAHDRPGTCDRGEVMSQEHLLAGGHIVDPILFLMGGRLPTRIDAQSSGEVGPVEDVGRHQKNTASEYEEDAAHVPFPERPRARARA